ncbi:PepSY domain-containing protein [Maribacter aestuarii]|uniref:PepSY domain-containing protein n=1 Tax=Maribacter aestuarii TaxID=1130723 RepID=UPI00248B3B4E|nr:PepSY domain-containing protein [Maribacter aestuarii]
MKKQRERSNKMRTYHRYLGFFLAGIMAVYALSGIILIFRDTDFLKNEYKNEKQLEIGLTQEKVGEALKIRNLKFQKSEGEIASFENGTYNTNTGMAEFTTKRLPLVLDKMTHLHKAKSADPLYFLNIFFGLSLLFFVLSSFWMFLPNTTIFKKGLYFTAAGMILVFVLLYL